MPTNLRFSMRFSKWIEIDTLAGLYSKAATTVSEADHLNLEGGVQVFPVPVCSQSLPWADISQSFHGL